MLKRLGYVVGSLILGFAAFWIWYCIAANYDYDALAGTYSYSKSNLAVVLVLKADQTFAEELTTNGQNKYANGTWRRIGEGGAVFSGDFLRLPGQRSYADSPGSEEASWEHPEFSGHFEKIWTVYPKLSLDAGSNEIVLQKRFFR